MNIKEAKDEIIHTLYAYLKKDSEGAYTYPLVRQRPILLMGPPGIGKTAIMEQIARECKVGLVAYTITHHTRQSAVGLPKIVTKNYGGMEVDITEYTMSEIIASVYECMEKTGKKEGILFIDEINCVSETLAPAMLQFLQNKTFGTHKVPEGWIIVAAGNPPEYNKSVREFDIVTLDRVRKIEIQPEADTWLSYARQRKLHGAVLSYLGLKKENFCVIENTVDGKFFVTARGWEDLSEILKSYEELQVKIQESLISQFIQKEEIARDFALYYTLYEKYKTDYQVAEILGGQAKKQSYESCVNMAKEAPFEEHFTLVELILEELDRQAEVFEKADKKTVLLYENLKQLKHFWKVGERTDTRIKTMEIFIQNKKHALQARKDAELLTEEEIREEKEQIHILEEYFQRVKERHVGDVQEGFEQIKEMFEKNCEKRLQILGNMEAMLNRAFDYVADCFGAEQEMLLLETGITGNQRICGFISEHGCPSYFKYSELLLYGRQEDAIREKCREILEHV